MQEYKPGDIAYIVDNDGTIREVTVVQYAGAIYVLRFTDTAELKLREEGLFPSREAAEKNIKGARH